MESTRVRKPFTAQQKAQAQLRYRRQKALKAASHVNENDFLMPEASNAEYSDPFMPSMPKASDEDLQHLSIPETAPTETPLDFSALENFILPPIVRVYTVIRTAWGVTQFISSMDALITPMLQVACGGRLASCSVFVDNEKTVQVLTEHQTCRCVN